MFSFCSRQVKVVRRRQNGRENLAAQMQQQAFQAQLAQSWAKKAGPLMGAGATIGMIRPVAGTFPSHRASGC